MIYWISNHLQSKSWNWTQRRPTVSLDSRVFSQNRPLLHSWRASKVWTAATEETQKCSHNPRNRYAEEQWKVRYTQTCIVYFSSFSFSFSSYFGFNCVLHLTISRFRGCIMVSYVKSWNWRSQVMTQKLNHCCSILSNCLISWSSTIYCYQSSQASSQ